MQQVFHIHSERIYPAGIGESATMALQLLMERPEWFAGAISLGGELPKLIDLPAGHQHLKNKRIFQGDIHQDVAVQHSETVQNIQTEWLLRKAGMHVVSKRYDTRANVGSNLLRDINHWVMDGVCTGV
jgi:predicted peptidase